MQRGDLCFVSGVSGYLGAWIAKELADRGFRVRGSVRSLDDTVRVAALRKLLPGVELVAADLRREESWPQAVSGCRWVFHVASPQAVRTEADRTGGALSGTRFLLTAAGGEPAVQKVIITSSEAAIAYGHARSKRQFDECNWTDLDGLDRRADYHRSKTLAERWAWDWAADAQLNPRGIPLATVNPSLILGPSLLPWPKFSLALLGDIAQGKMPLMLDMTVRIVDVRDCARMHLAVMADPACNGRRHLCMSLPTTLAELARSVARGHGAQGFKPKARVMPSWLARMLAPLSADLASVRSHIGNDIRYTTLHPGVYRYEHRDLDTIVSASLDSMLAHGWLSPRRA
ncbi:MAG: NAD-dependent epimerase/dehydratase family protein [Burkholderiaceae bacterium]|jgi:nucleoside-diphosphate-sugar epimerase|nr:NAD-dependent epimerase/dehydratase family protein [Burkholderiaceae bacterium]